MIWSTLSGLRRRTGLRGGESPRLAASTTYGLTEPTWLTSDLLGESSERWVATPEPRTPPAWSTSESAWSVTRGTISPGSRGLLLSTDDQQPVCAASGCSSHPRFWKKTARPVFEGRWTCSRSCLESMVRASLRRELMESSQPASTPHNHRIPLGLVLLSQGAIDESQLRASLAAQRSSGGRIGDWLVQQGAVPESAITRALGRQWGCPVLREEMLAIETIALAMPASLREQWQLQPLCVAGRRFLYVGFQDQLDAAGVFALERMSGLTVVPGVLTSTEYGNCARRLGTRETVRCEQVLVEGEDEMAVAIADKLLQHEPSASRLVAVAGRVWLRLWLEPGVVGASGTLPVSHEDMLDVLLG